MSVPAACRFASLLVSFVAAGVTAAAAGEEFRADLFDGKSLQGWTVENGCEADVQDGCILLKAGDGWLRTDHTYRDFLLHLEWKALQAERYDAGVYLRASREGAPFPKTGYQVNMQQGKEGNIGNLPGAASTGLVKPGAWNTFDIEVIGENVAVSINGKPAYKVGGLKHLEGHIGLQIEVPKGGQFLVRNIRVTEIGYRSLFNGKDFAGWEGAGQPAETCWEARDGVLTVTQAKGPWLRSVEEFGDFNLRFDYLVAPGANSGVYVRVPKDGNHHRDNDTKPPAGFEVQILDDAAPKYAKLKDYQYSGSVYDIAGARERVSKPAGEWNTLEINCRGQHVSTTHNGVVIVDVDPEQFPLIKLREVKGFLGLQNHGGGVSFRNLRIGPARGSATDIGTATSSR